MEKTHSDVPAEQYTNATFNMWSDGPKYVFNTVGLPIKIPTECTVLTVRPGMLKPYLDLFLINSVATIYFVDDADTAQSANALRPDLDIRLLLV